MVSLGRMTRRSILAFAVLAWSCGGDRTLAPPCVPGQSIACVGPGGCAGGQVCNAAGSGYGACDCAGRTSDAGLSPVIPDAAAPSPDAVPDLPLPAPDVWPGVSPDLPGPDLPPPVPLSCQSMGVASPLDFEIKFVIPRCGGESGCHQAIFPPRQLHMLPMIRSNLVGKKALTFCKNDFYIDIDHPERSYMLATVTPYETKVTCPSGGEGGTRMPNSMPTVAGPRLTEEEIDCFRWWVFELAAIARRR